MPPPNQRPKKPDKLCQGAQSQTSYPKVQWENTLDKKGTADPQQGEEELSQEVMGNLGSQSRNTLGYTHAAGG